MPKYCVGAIKNLQLAKMFFPDFLCYVYVDYSVPFDALRAELNTILQSSDQWDGVVSNLQVTNATEKTVEVRILVSKQAPS